jgi:fibronectin type 3 domain-containing protein
LDSAATYDSQKGSVPAIPTGFSAKAAFSNGGTFVWAVVSNATSYNVKRSRASVGPFVTIGNTPWAAFTDSNLVNGTTYYYSISAVNQYGQSGNSAAKSFSTSATLGTPVIQGIGMYDEFPQHTSFSWLPMSTNDLMYEIQWAHKMPDNSCDPFKTLYLPGGDQWAVVRNTTWAKDTTSETNTELAFRIRCRTYAKDSTGMAIKDDVSPWSSITYYSNPAISPLDVPTNLAATMSGVGPEKLKVTWTSDDIANLAFEVYYKTNGGVWQLSTLFGALDSIPNLKRNTQYQLCIRAVNNNVFPPLYSKFSNIISATTSANLAAPTNLFASMVARNQISLMWSDNSVSESGYYIERATSKTGSYTQIASVGTDVNTYSNTGLSDGQIFWYRVRAYSGSTYSAYSNLISDTVARNLALSRTPSATSSQGSYPAKNGNDNVTTTRWAASGSVPQTWTVDLGRPSNVITSEVMWEQSGTGKVYKYKVEYSDDNKNWFTMADLSSNTSTAQTQVQNWGYGSYAVTTRYVHISVIGVPSGAFASFYEFRVFGN